MDVTVAICTHDRAASLARTLGSLATLRLPPGLRWELLVVLNRCTDASAEMVAGFADRLPTRVVSDESNGLSGARNMAVRQAAGRYILFTDDDVVVDAEWLAAYARAFARWPGASVFGGRIEPVLEGDAPAWLRDGMDALGAMLAKRDLGPDPAPLSAQDDRVPYGASFACKLDDLRRYPFRADLGPGLGQRRGGDETTVLKAMLDDGLIGRWVPDACVAHMISPERQTWRYVSGYYRAIGETVALLEGDAGASFVFGAPRWLWRRTARNALRFAWARLTRPAPAYVLSFRLYAVDCGQLRHWRRRRRARRETTMPQPYDQTFYAEQQDGSLAAARIVMPIVLAAFPARSIVDIGCGVGAWLRVAHEAGVSELDGYDGDYVDRSMLHIDAERFHPTDLAAAFTLPRRYDLALSLEVAEHLPPAAGDGFIGRLTDAAPVVVFSAAIPGQGGTDHLNECWPDEWRACFARRGYRPVDAVRPLVRGNTAVPFWYQQNIVAYCDAATLAARPDLRGVPDGVSLNVVHPELYEYAVARGEMYLSKALRMLPGLVGAAAARRLGRPG